jgi:hypothetical protein
MTVILMSQEIASRGSGQDIAASAAASLGLEFVPEELVERLVASRMHIEQDRLRRMVAGRASLFERWTRDGRRVAKFTAEELLKLAAHDDVVIQCWGGARLLRSIQHIIRVHVCVSELRCPRLHSMQETLVAPVYMQSLASSRKRSRPAVLWEQGSGYNRELFDLVLCTMSMSATECVERVIQLAQSPFHQATEESRTALADLLQEIQEYQNGIGMLADPSGPCVLDVEVNYERIRLTGITSNEQAIADIEERLRGKRPPHKIPWRDTPPSRGII